MNQPAKFLKSAVLLAVSLFFLSEAFSNFTILRRAAARFSPDTENTVARVSGQTITRSQLERATRERLWLEGKSLESLTPADRKIAREAALEDLIDHELLRAQTMANAPRVSDSQIDERMQRFLGRFESKDAMIAAMKSQGIASERDLRERIAAMIRQETFVESKISPLAEVTDAEARTWFEENSESLANPERIEARHLFLPTLDHPPEEAKAKLEAALADLTAGKKDFATLAREISEDPATMDSGGSLGWMSRARIPVDFSAPVFSLPLNQPTLVRTRLGWHLVEVTARKPAEARDFETAKPEIIAALEAVKRRQAIQATRETLRREATEKIEVFHDRMAE